jgi:hypothetical protein
MATLGVSSGDGSSADAVESFLRSAAFVLPDPLPLPRCLFSPLDPRASDSQLYQRLRRFVASPLYQRLRRFVASPLYQRVRRFVASPLYQRIRRFVASPLYQRIRRFVASSLRRFVASSLHCICGSVGYVVFCFSCSGCQGQCVSRSGGSVVFGVSRSVGSAMFCSCQ